MKLRWLLILSGGLFVALAVSFYAQLAVPAPTGTYAVGRTSLHWTTNRPEVVTPTTEDRRELPLVVWYPAQPNTGTPTPYYPGLETIAAGLAASGEVHPLEVWGLRFIRSVERLEAAPVAGRWPVLLLSPGNGTNVEFYAALAGELASQGYIVIGLNHPYDVAAVALSAGDVAQFAPPSLALSPAAYQVRLAERVAERVADVQSVLDQLEPWSVASAHPLAAQMDLGRLGVLGHSLGGLTAAQACQADARLQACLNLDGVQGGGPFGVTTQPALPTQAFMFLTKETTLSPHAAELWSQLTGPAYRHIVAGAAHDNFTDGPLLLPGLLPTANRADAILAEVRRYTLAFMDASLKGQPSALLDTARYPVN